MNKHQLTGQGGKGDKRRQEDKAKFDAGWVRIFGNKDEDKPENKKEKPKC